MKFQEIVNEAKRTAHKIYGLGITITEEIDGRLVSKERTIFHKPKQGEILSPRSELIQNRNAERAERAQQIASLYHAMTARFSDEEIEEKNPCLEGSLPPAKYMSLADNDMVIRFTGLS